MRDQYKRDDGVPLAPIIVLFLMMIVAAVAATIYLVAKVAQ